MVDAGGVAELGGPSNKAMFKVGRLLRYAMAMRYSVERVSEIDGEQ